MVGMSRLCWKTLFLVLINKICCRTGGPVFGGEGLGQIGLLLLMCQLSPPQEQSHPTTQFEGLLPENCEI